MLFSVPLLHSLSAAAPKSNARVAINLFYPKLVAVCCMAASLKTLSKQGHLPWTGGSISIGSHPHIARIGRPERFEVERHGRLTIATYAEILPRLTANQ